MMKRISLALALLGAATMSQALVRILTTTPDLASIAAAVGGKNVSVSSLVTGARDPHRIEAKPSFMSKVGSADLFIAIGLDLEAGYEQPILEGSRNGKVRVGSPGHVYASDWTYILDRPTGPVSRAEGDVHPYGNPHVWLDPYNGRLIAGKLAQKLSQMDPGNAASYRSNLAAFLKRLDTAMFGSKLVDRFGGEKLWEWQRTGLLTENLRKNNVLSDLAGWAGQMLPFAGRPIVTYHRSLGYFANRFGLRVVDELEPKPGIEPSPGSLAGVIRAIQQAGVKTIVQESFYSTKHAKFVGARTGAKVVVIPQNVGHDPGAKDYISLFDTIVDRMVAGLR